MSIFFVTLWFLSFLFLCFTFLIAYFMEWQLPSPKLLYNTFGRDIRIGFRYLKSLLFVTRCYTLNLTVGKIFQSLVKKHPNRVCFLFQDEEWTYQQVEDYSNKVANAFETAGFRKGDEVALIMENRPEYVCIWLGLSKIGVVSALINTNLRLHSLAHSINVIDCKAIIFSSELAFAVKDAFSFLNKKTNTEYICLGEADNNSNLLHFKSLELLLRNASKNSPQQTTSCNGFKDVLFYIYTSGTTGLPKAAVIRHSRFIWIGTTFKYLTQIRNDDVIYNSLPMYHSSGGITKLAIILTFGGKMAIRKKFSASNFWKDAVKYKVTVSSYIGEICRYLLNQPECPEEAQHNIRLMIGNGLRPHVWKKFQKRFKIPQIIEFYGSTEGNTNAVNPLGKIGAVGFISRLFQRAYPLYLIRVNPETGVPIRDENGFCIRCKPGEPGEIVGKIVRSNPINSFDGYADVSETRKKVITNCFRQGDEAFLSGDILVMDEDGYLFFLDRRGDTFRWRGENVSTAEVESVISKALDQATCIVYGVHIPGVEGKPGMAAIQSDRPINMDVLFKQISSSLPSYAVPFFVKICKNIELTGTYKLKKIELQKAGFCPEKTTDPIFMLDYKTHSYVKLDKSRYNQIINGEIRL